ncbi:glycoside hydrolase family 6 protein [Streptomyces sp. TP-A0875]|uniref:glycoside hydrolase family 6 protein n=1 Tax=Streptomyces sp. TP-A0875 TaxID=552354 RepID=UPI0006B5769D|nr:glycoside hydrolase family 6 protein [Streptomyces sp. TP-A0875]
MVAAASVVVAAGAAAGTLSALRGDGRADEARPAVTASPRLEALPVPPPLPPSATPSAPSAPATPSPSGPPAPSAPSRPAPDSTRQRSAATASGLYRHPRSQVLDWVRAHPDDPRRAVIASRIGDHPAAVWFADPSPATVTARVREVTSGAAAEGRVPVVVPYAIPGRDCGGHSGGGAPDLAAYDGWIDRFAAGLGSGEVIVILEPDSVSQAECLTEGERGARFASLARAGRVLKAAAPGARVYYDAGHSGWHAPARQAGWLRQAGAGAAASSDGVFSNVSNFHATADEIAYDRAVLDALGGPPDLGAVVDTSRNGNGAPPGGQWCDPGGRTLGRAPTLATGERGIDAYLWVKLPGESDGCEGPPGTFSPSYAYDLAR